jgi:phospholipid/cholesterol/gamma-HCH transport system ATP-binding protein
MRQPVVNADGIQGRGEIALETVALTGGYGKREVLHNVSLRVQKGEIFVIVGRSGCGKSTLLNYLIGLEKPWSGRVLFEGKNLWSLKGQVLDNARRTWGVLFQSGALLGSLTLAENVMLPLDEHCDLTAREMELVAMHKLDTVGLAEFADAYPLEVSGGMQKRAALARAMALDPEVLFFDEPSAGLDPVTSAELDDLICSINRDLGTTIVIVTHELASIYRVAERVVMLDRNERGIIAEGNPAALRGSSDDPRVVSFFTRGGGSPRGGR